MPVTTSCGEWLAVYKQDLIFGAANFGTLHTGSSGATPAESPDSPNVPEPTALCLMLVAAIGMVGPTRFGRR